MLKTIFKHLQKIANSMRYKQSYKKFPIVYLILNFKNNFIFHINQNSIKFLKKMEFFYTKIFNRDML